MRNLVCHWVLVVCATLFGLVSLLTILGSVIVLIGSQELAGHKDLFDIWLAWAKIGAALAVLFVVARTLQTADAYERGVLGKR